MRRWKKKRSNGMKLITLIVMIICLVVLYKTNVLCKDIDQKVTRIEKLDERIEKETQKTTSFVEKKDYQGTKRYIEEIARNKLSLYYPDEIIFKEKKD